MTSGVYLVPQNSIKSWTLTETICQESCTLRKFDTANRLAGIRPSSSSSSSSPQTASIQPLPVESSIATKEELMLLSKTSLNFLNNIVQHPQLLGSSPSSSTADEFQHCLCLAFISLTSTPRTQIIKELSISPAKEPTLFRTETSYEIKMPAQKSKNRQPVVLVVPENLTSIFDFHISTVRPLLLQKRLSQGQDAGYFFMNKSGQQKTTFCDWIRRLTNAIIKRPLNTHSFRASITTLYFENCTNSNSNLQMHKLANLMNHSP